MSLQEPLCRYTGHTLAKFIVTLFTGIITGVIAVGLSKFVGLLAGWKLNFIQATLTGSHAVPPEEESETVEASLGAIIAAFFKFWIFGSVLVSFATAMVQYWAPASAGAGVTLVMAYLNGNHIPNLLRVSTLISKFVGTICSVSAGLPMGPEVGN
jgi:chloride channel 7